MKKIIILIMSLLLAGCDVVLANEIRINEYQAVRAIIGEALPNYQAMYAIACAIRNRGTLKGVYGLNAKHVKEATGNQFQLASKAWAESETGIDVTNGATHWLSDYDLNHCNKKRTAFRFKMLETAYIGQTHFYLKDSIKAHQLYEE